MISYENLGVCKNRNETGLLFSQLMVTKYFVICKMMLYIKNYITIAFATCLLTLTVASTFAQRIPWSAGRPLTWDDFVGNKPRKSKFAAVTSSRLHYELKMVSDDSFKVKVDCFFNPLRSWKKNTRLKPYLLKHEQGHFDITEIYARKIRRSFKKYELHHANKLNMAFKFRLIYERKRRSWRHYEKKYDRQTRHSRRKQEQEEWNQRIADQLHELSSYEVR